MTGIESDEVRRSWINAMANVQYGLKGKALDSTLFVMREAMLANEKYVPSMVSSGKDGEVFFHQWVSDSRRLEWIIYPDGSLEFMEFVDNKVVELVENLKAEDVRKTIAGVK